MTQLRDGNKLPLPINRDAEGWKRGDLELMMEFLGSDGTVCTLIEVVVKSRHEMFSKCTELYTHTRG